MASDDLLEGVKEKILPLGVLVDLRENEGKVALEIPSTHTPCKKEYQCPQTYLIVQYYLDHSRLHKMLWKHFQTSLHVCLKSTHANGYVIHTI